MIFLTREHIIRINSVVVASAKGLFIPPDNLLNPNSLDWVLNTIQYPIFNTYETVEEKAALLCWTIIRDHVFYDGNKRTGITALELFLSMNNIFLRASNDAIIKIALYVADDSNKHTSKGKLVSWIIANEF